MTKMRSVPGVFLSLPMNSPDSLAESTGVLSGASIFFLSFWACSSTDGTARKAISSRLAQTRRRMNGSPVRRLAASQASVARPPAGGNNRSRTYAIGRTGQELDPDETEKFRRFLD